MYAIGAGSHLRRLVFLCGLVWAPPAISQTGAPITVTPPTLLPTPAGQAFRIVISDTGGMTPPAGAENLSVTLASVTLEGGFSEVSGQTDAVIRRLQGKSITLAEIYAAASEIEAIHGRAGFVLARAAVPPQDLHDGGALRLIIVDGFVEAVDVSRLPRRVRKAVAARSARLIGRRHLTLGQIEQPLLITSQTPGLNLKSTLVRGKEPGGTMLVLEGTQRLLSGNIGADNQLDPSLDNWSITAQVSVNSALGLGEQIYGFASSGYDIGRLFSGDVRERVLGGGVLLPIGGGRLTLNPETSFSRTRPLPVPGAPPTLGDLHRLTLRAGYALSRTRTSDLAVSAAIEQLEESNKVPTFGAAGVLSRDRYLSARLGISTDRFGPGARSYTLSAQLSQGLGDAGGLGLAQAEATTINGYSRVGADNAYTKLAAQGRGEWLFGSRISVDVFARGQTSFGRPLFRAEQFAIEGPDGASAFVGGATAVDEGVVTRAELSRVARANAGTAFALAPYVFVAGGIGSISRPTVLERDRVRVGSIGVGSRIAIARWGLAIGLEYAHGASNLRSLGAIDRGNILSSIRF